MPLYIMYFNLKDSKSEEEFVKKAKEWVNYIKDKIEGLGSMKLFRHHAFGANQRTKERGISNRCHVELDLETFDFMKPS